RRRRRVPGAMAPGSGLVAGPTPGVIVLALVYRRLAGAEILHSMLEGAAASAVGLIIAMTVDSARAIFRAGKESGHPMGRSLAAMGIAVATFVGIGLLRWPTVPTVLSLAAISMGLSLLSRRAVSGIKK